MAQSEFDNTYGVMLMGMGVGRDFPDFDDYDEVRWPRILTFLAFFECQRCIRMQFSSMHSHFRKEKIRRRRPLLFLEHYLLSIGKVEIMQFSNLI